MPHGGPGTGSSCQLRWCEAWGTLTRTLMAGRATSCGRVGHGQDRGRWHVGFNSRHYGIDGWGAGLETRTGRSSRAASQPPGPGYLNTSSDMATGPRGASWTPPPGRLLTAVGEGPAPAVATGMGWGGGAMRHPPPGKIKFSAWRASPLSRPWARAGLSPGRLDAASLCWHSWWRWRRQVGSLRAASAPLLHGLHAAEESLSLAHLQS